MDEPIEHRLERWLSEVEGAPVTVEGFAPVSAGARRVNALFDAVRPGGTERLSFTMNQTEEIEIIGVAVEAGVRTLAEQAGVRTPKIHHVCTDPSAVGGPFFISTAVDGVSIPRQIMRKVDSLGLGETIVDQLGTAMARLHSIDIDLAPELLPRPENADPVMTALGLLREAIDTMVEPSPTFSMALRRLEDSAPDEPASIVIVHRDIRVGNIIVDDDGLA
ncbi:MAG: phosphotransferase, partial [Acidimicrobiales bacterium]